jgi:hypothetical protein
VSASTFGPDSHQQAAGPIVEMNNRRDGTREMLNSLRSKRVRDGQLVPLRPTSLDRPPLPRPGNGSCKPKGRTGLQTRGPSFPDHLWAAYTRGLSWIGLAHKRIGPSRCSFQCSRIRPEDPERIEPVSRDERRDGRALKKQRRPGLREGGDGRRRAPRHRSVIAAPP